MTTNQHIVVTPADGVTRLYDLNDLAALADFTNEDDPLLPLRPSTLRNAASTPERKFPRPVTKFGHTPVYSKSAVLAWYGENYK